MARKTRSGRRCQVIVHRQMATMHREYIERFAEFMRHLPSPYYECVINVEPLSYRQRGLASCKAITIQYDQSPRGRRYRLAINFLTYRDATTEQLFTLLMQRCSDPHLKATLQQMYDHRQPQLGIVWAFPPAPPKKRMGKTNLSPVQVKVVGAKYMVAKWKRRLRMAEKKVDYYEKQLRRCERKAEAYASLKLEVPCDSSS